MQNYEDTDDEMMYETNRQLEQRHKHQPKQQQEQRFDSTSEINMYEDDEVFSDVNNSSTSIPPQTPSAPPPLPGNKQIKWPSTDSRFQEILTRKMSTHRRPLLNRPKADRNRRADYEVEISFIFIRIGEINTLSETFFAEAFMEAKWYDKSFNSDLYDVDMHWNPEIILENAIRGLTVKKSYSVKERVNHRKGAVISEKWIFKGIFWKSLTLRNFPIDVQELTVSLASLKPIIEIKFHQSQSKISAVIQDGFIDQQEWKLYSFVTCKEVLVSHKFSADEYPVMNITAYTCRRPNYYYYNAFFLIFLISISSLTTFSMSCDVPQARLQTACTVLLTSITFKWVINRSLPTVYYLTSLDFYSLVNIVLICVKCVWHATIGYFTATRVTEYTLSERIQNIKQRNLTVAVVSVNSSHCRDQYAIYDGVAFGFFVILFICINFGFLYWYFFKAKRDAKILNEKEANFLNELNQYDSENSFGKSNSRKYRYKSIYVNKGLMQKRRLPSDQDSSRGGTMNFRHGYVLTEKKPTVSMTVRDCKMKRSYSHLALFNGQSTKSTQQQPIFAILQQPNTNGSLTKNDPATLIQTKSFLSAKNPNFFTIQSPAQTEMDV